MCQLLETIKVRQNMLQNVSFHNQRVNHSRGALFQAADTWNLSELIAMPALNADMTYRCRMLYSHAVEQVDFLEYTPRIIQKLLLVYVENLDYSFKYANRDALDKLKSSTAAGATADILIVKNGLITDTSFSNIAFFDGSKWYTPDSPLLKGTKRALYLNSGMLTARRIKPEDLPIYQKARLINAMLDLEDGNDISMENIIG
jgi:4-amino-4-deoxychorismate lyase